jgi:hypothetical protein
MSIATEWLALLLRFWEVSDSYLARRAAFASVGFRGFPQSLR